MSKKFIVDNGSEHVAEDRVFKNNKVVFNTRLGFAYSVDEIVEVLNELGRYDDWVYDLMQNRIWHAQGMYHRTNDEKYKVLEETLKELREELYEPKNSSKKYAKILNNWYIERTYDGD